MYRQATPILSQPALCNKWLCVCTISHQLPHPPIPNWSEIKYSSGIIIVAASSLQPYVNFPRVYTSCCVTFMSSCPVSFSWLTPLLHLGKKKRLEESDMYRILPEDRSETLGEELQRYLLPVTIKQWDLFTTLSPKKCHEKGLGRLPP